MRKLLSATVAFVILFSCALLSFGVSAVEPIVIDTPASLTLTYVYDDTVFEGFKVNVYRVANVYPNSSFGVSDEFGDYAISLNTVKSQSEWNVIAQTFMSYVIADLIEPTVSAVTDSEGKVSFDSLETGLYLVSDIRGEYDKGYCTFDSFMIMIPGVSDDGLWNYDVDAKPKSVYVQTQPDDVEYSILKLWKDTGYEGERPDTVEIALYKDGEYVETVTLSADNNWHYEWTAPDDGAIWTAVEINVATGYTVTVEEKENTFVVSNTYRQTPPPPETGDSFNFGIYAVMIAISGFGLVTIGILSRRRG